MKSRVKLFTEILSALSNINIYIDLQCKSAGSDRILCQENWDRFSHNAGNSMRLRGCV